MTVVRIDEIVYMEYPGGISLNSGVIHFKDGRSLTISKEEYAGLFSCIKDALKKRNLPEGLAAIGDLPNAPKP